MAATSKPSLGKKEGRICIVLHVANGLGSAAVRDSVYSIGVCVLSLT